MSHSGPPYNVSLEVNMVRVLLRNESSFDWLEVCFATHSILVKRDYSFSKVLASFPYTNKSMKRVLCEEFLEVPWTMYPEKGK